ncbi:ribonuclease H-like domain-containing protein [Mycena vulgaris]|nr:ribonuclease H-like domain-containing protein [Mycena vulgaris]
MDHPPSHDSPSAIGPVQAGTQEGPTKMEEPDYINLKKDLMIKNKLGVVDIVYITTENHADSVLESITNGVIGLDTKFMKRVLYGNEEVIENLKTMGGPAKKNARQAIQYLESINPEFSIQWENTGLCLVQIARDDASDLKPKCPDSDRSTAIPSQMLHVLSSDAIVKVGVGIASDAQVFWEDTQIILINMVDAGLMARLVNVEKHQEEPYTNLSLNNAAAEVLGISVNKLYQKGVNWKREPHDTYKPYAALNTIISLHLYKNLAPVLQADGALQGKAVPEDCVNAKSEKRACLSATAAKMGWRVTYELPSMRDEVEEG